MAGKCTLNEAITAANKRIRSGDGGPGECVAGDPDPGNTNTIVLQPGQTYTLTQPYPPLPFGTFSGKTRLALEVASAVQDGYVDGVWLVELPSLADGALVPQTVAAVFNLRETLDQPIASSLAEALRERRVLLVLDNCEHLLDGCAQLVDRLLRACSEMRVLATSREALGITGEIAWRVPSLPLLPVCFSKCGTGVRGLEHLDPCGCRVAPCPDHAFCDPYGWSSTQGSRYGWSITQDSATTGAPLVTKEARAIRGGQSTSSRTRFGVLQAPAIARLSFRWSRSASESKTRPRWMRPSRMSGRVPDVLSAHS